MQSFQEKEPSSGASPATGESTLADRLFALVKAVLPIDDERFQMVEDNDLTFGQVKALIHLARNDEPMSGGALAESVGVSAPVASRSLDSLVQKDFASREECASDRRVRLFSITESGAEIAGELAALRRAHVEGFVAGIPPEPARRFEELLTELEESGLIGGACGGSGDGR